MTDIVRVPREPTQAMLDAFLRCIPTDYTPDRHEKRAAYAAMLAASPQGEGSSIGQNDQPSLAFSGEGEKP